MERLGRRGIELQFHLVEHLSVYYKYSKKITTDNPYRFGRTFFR